MVDRVAELWKDGLSASQISEEFGCSRSAILGLTNRHPDKFSARQLKGRLLKRLSSQPSSLPRSAAPAQSRADKTGAVPSPAAPVNPLRLVCAPVENLPATLPIAFLEAMLKGRCLHYVGNPLGVSGPDMPVCGAERAEGVLETRYCRRHLASQRQAVAA